MAFGTLGFGIPALVVPDRLNKLIARSGDYNPENTFYVYMFALRECYLGASFWVASQMTSSSSDVHDINKNLGPWLKYAILVLASHLVLNIAHPGWNPSFQPAIIVIHGLLLLWNMLVYYQTYFKK